MADDDLEFVAAIEQALKEKGILEKLTCQVRAEILQVLKSPLVTKKTEKLNKFMARN